MAGLDFGAYWPLRVAYSIGFIAFGATPGMHLVGVRVIDAEGRDPGWRRSAIRFIIPAASVFAMFQLIVEPADVRGLGFAIRLASAIVSLALGLLDPRWIDGHHAVGDGCLADRDMDGALARIVCVRVEVEILFEDQQLVGWATESRCLWCDRRRDGARDLIFDILRNLRLPIRPDAVTAVECPCSTQQHGGQSDTQEDLLHPGPFAHLQVDSIE